MVACNVLMLVWWRTGEILHTTTSVTRHITMVDILYCADILYAAVEPSGQYFVIFCDFELKSSEKKNRKVLLDICVCSGII